MDNTSKLFAIVVGLAVLSALFTLAMPDGMAPTENTVQAAPANTGAPQPAGNQGNDGGSESFDQSGPAIENPAPPPPSGSQPMQNL